MKILIPIIISILLINACEKNGTTPVYENMEVTSRLILDRSIIIPFNGCAGDFRTNTFLCLDSVLNDSRCPSGALCIWAGDAETRLKFSVSGEKPVYFNLHTFALQDSYTTVSGYRITMKQLLPYPSLNYHPQQNDYRAEMLVEKTER